MPNSSGRCVAPSPACRRPGRRGHRRCTDSRVARAISRPIEQRRRRCHRHRLAVPTPCDPSSPRPRRAPADRTRSSTRSTGNRPPAAEPLGRRVPRHRDPLRVRHRRHDRPRPDERHRPGCRPPRGADDGCLDRVRPHGRPESRRHRAVAARTTPGTRQTMILRTPVRRPVRAFRGRAIWESMIAAPSYVTGSARDVGRVLGESDRSSQPAAGSHEMM